MSLLKHAMLPKKNKAAEVKEEARDLSSSAIPCTVNVEVLIDGCSHDLDVIAPAVRVINSTLANTQYNTDPNDECVTNIETDILFTSQPDTLSGSYVSSVECWRAVPGRPFVDYSTGKTLQASSIVLPKGKNDGLWPSSESLDIEESSPSAHFHNSTTINQNQLLLGREWERNALGEHASVQAFPLLPLHS